MRVRKAATTDNYKLTIRKQTPGLLNFASCTIVTNLIQKAFTGSLSGNEYRNTTPRNPTNCTYHGSSAEDPAVGTDCLQRYFCRDRRFFSTRRSAWPIYGRLHR